MNSIDRQAIIARIHSKAKKYFTNTYMNAQQLSDLLLSQSTLFKARQDMAVLVYPDGAVWRMLCFADSVECLSCLELPKYGEKYSSALFEVIGTDETLATVQSVLSVNSIGLRKYARLYKMTYQVEEYPVIKDTVLVENAATSDAERIAEMLNTVFDKNISHIPSVDAILAYIESNQVKIVREHNGAGKVIAFAMVDRIRNKTRYIFQIAVDDAFRRQGLAKKLLAVNFIQEGIGMNYSLWVEENNTAAINFYNGLGFSISKQRTDIYKV